MGLFSTTKKGGGKKRIGKKLVKSAIASHPAGKTILFGTSLAKKTFKKTRSIVRKSDRITGKALKNFKLW